MGTVTTLAPFKSVVWLGTLNQLMKSVVYCKRNVAGKSGQEITNCRSSPHRILERNLRLDYQPEAAERSRRHNRQDFLAAHENRLFRRRHPGLRQTAHRFQSHVESRRPGKGQRLRLDAPLSCETRRRANERKAVKIARGNPTNGFACKRARVVHQNRYVSGGVVADAKLTLEVSAPGVEFTVGSERQAMRPAR